MNYIIPSVSRDDDNAIVGVLALWQTQQTDPQTGQPLYDYDLLSIWDVMRMIKKGQVFRVKNGGEVYVVGEGKDRKLRSDSDAQNPHTLSSLPETKFQATN